MLTYKLLVGGTNQQVIILKTNLKLAVLRVEHDKHKANPVIDRTV